MIPSYWVSSAAQEHVFIVKDKGYTQANMGSREALTLMNIGDWILYYSPTIYFEQEDSVCQKFTGIACVVDDKIYPQSNLYPDRWRRNVEFFNCVPHHPKNFIQKVSFLPDLENWNEVLSQQFFGIPRDDFVLIAKKILIPEDNRILVY